MYSTGNIFHLIFSVFIVVMTVIMVVRRLRTGLENHYEIQESIELLQNRLGAPKSDYEPSGQIYNRFIEDLADDNNLTAMAKDILMHCRKQFWSITVSKAKNLGPHTAGQYMSYGSSNSGQIVIRIGDDANERIILSVLIHECMHHFLRISGIGFEDSHKNEVLTDTAALYLGFSEYMNRGYIGVGYLSYRELLYAEKLISKINVLGV